MSEVLDGSDVPLLGGPIDCTSRAMTEAGRDIGARGRAARRGSSRRVLCWDRRSP